MDPVLLLVWQRHSDLTRDFFLTYVLSTTEGKMGIVNRGLFLQKKQNYVKLIAKKPGRI